MADFRDDLALRAIALGQCTAVGTDLFLGTKAKLPAGDGPYTVMVQTGGTSAERRHDGRYPQPACQITVKAKSASVARNKAQALLSALGDKYNVTMNGNFYLKVIAVQEVMDLSVEDGSGLAKFGFNLNGMSR